MPLAPRDSGYAPCGLRKTLPDLRVRALVHGYLRSATPMSTTNMSLGMETNLGALTQAAPSVQQDRFDSVHQAACGEPRVLY